MAKTKRYADGGEMEEESFVEAGSGPMTTEDSAMFEKEPEVPSSSKPKVKPKAAPKGVPRESKEKQDMRIMQDIVAKKKAKDDERNAMLRRGQEMMASNYRSRGTGSPAAPRASASASRRPMSAGNVPFETFTFASGGKVSSASKRADGIAQKGKTRGKMC